MTESVCHFVVVRHLRQWSSRPTVRAQVLFTGTRAACERALQRKLDRCPAHVTPDYRLLAASELDELKRSIAGVHSENRKAGAARAKEQAARRAEQGRPAKRFILCPTCQAKSKKLRSEFGGLQTRRCQNGHLFEVDTFFGVETSKRRIEQVDRPYFAPSGGNYNDWVYGRFKDDPSGKKEEPK